MPLLVAEGNVELFLVLCYPPSSPWSFLPAVQKQSLLPSATAPVTRRCSQAKNLLSETENSRDRVRNLC